MKEVDGPVEIELDPTPPPRRGRRARGHRDESQPTFADDHRNDLHRPSRPVADVDTSDVETSDAGTSGDPSPVAGRRARLVAGAAALLVVGFLLGRSGTSEPSRTAEVAEATPTSTVAPPPTTRAEVDRSLVTLPSASPPRSSAAPSRERAPTTTVAPLRVLDLGGPLVPSPTGLVIVGLTTQGELAEVDLDRGVARLVDVPDLPAAQAGNSGFVHVGPTSAIVGSWERQTMHVVPVDGEPYQLPTSLSRSAHIVAAGPGPDLFWVHPFPEGPDYQPTIALADVSTGAIVGDEVALASHLSGFYGPINFGQRILVNGVGGTYQIHGPNADATDGATVRRISEGVVVGAGPAHVLAVECDEQLRCAAVLIGDDGERTVTPTPISRVGWAWNPSSVSPDGSTLAVHDEQDLRGGVALIDLASGDETSVRASSTTFTSPPEPTSIVWSEDSRVVVFLVGRRLSYYDRDVGEVVQLAEDLPSLVGFDVRRSVPGTGASVPPPARR